MLGIEINQLGAILCRYDTCPTQYAPNFIVAYCVGRVHKLLSLERESILCMVAYCGTYKALG